MTPWRMYERLIACACETVSEASVTYPGCVPHLLANQLRPAIQHRVAQELSNCPQFFKCQCHNVTGIMTKYGTAALLLVALCATAQGECPIAEFHTALQGKYIARGIAHNNMYAKHVLHSDCYGLKYG